MPGIFGSISSNKTKTKLQPFINEYHFLAEELDSEKYSLKAVGFDFQKEYTHLFNQENKTLLLYGDPLINGLTGEEARKAAAEILLNLESNYNEIAFVDGLFSAVLINESSQEISIINDRNGLAHIFYSYIDDELCIASELRTFVDVDSSLKLTIREEAITEFMELGYHIENATYFNEVSLLPPASILKYNYKTAELAVESYFSFKQIEKINTSYAEAKVKIAELLKASINKRVGEDERVGVTLSGGLDSRLLFAGLPERNLPYTAITRGRKGCGDIKIAAQVASLRHDAKHIIYDMNVDNWLLNRQKGVIATSGQKTFFDMNAIASVHTHKEHFDINLDGAGGDGVFQFTLIKGDDERIKQGLSTVFYRNSFNKPPKTLDKLFDCYKKTNNYQFYFIHQNIRRFSIFGSMLGHDFGVVSRFPYLDHDLQEYIYSLPDNIDYNKIYREILLSYFRKYYLIDNNNTGSRVYVSNKLNFIARGINFVRRKIGKTKYKNPYHNYPVWLKENDAGLLDKFLKNKNSALFKYIDYEKFIPKLDGYMQTNSHSAIISRALSLAIFLDYLEDL